MIDITQEIKDGKYDHPKLSFFGHKLFGRRIFVKIGKLILLGHLQYTFDKERFVVIVYIDFNFRKNAVLREDHSLNLKIKEYPYETGMDLIAYVNEIRKEIIKVRPQNKGYKWSFVAKELL